MHPTPARPAFPRRPSPASTPFRKSRSRPATTRRNTGRSAAACSTSPCGPAPTSSTGPRYDYFVNEAFNAGNPFTSTATNSAPRARRNDYGFTVGGPIRKRTTRHSSSSNSSSSARRKTSTTSFRPFPLRPIEPAISAEPSREREGRSASIRGAANARRHDLRSHNDARRGRTLVRDPFPNNQIVPRSFRSGCRENPGAVPQPNGPNANGLTSNYPSIVSDDQAHGSSLDQDRSDSGTRENSASSGSGQRPRIPTATRFSAVRRFAGSDHHGPRHFPERALYRLNYDYTL